MLKFGRNILETLELSVHVSVFTKVCLFMNFSSLNRTPKITRILREYYAVLLDIFIIYSAVKEFWKSVKIWESYWQKFGGFLFWGHGVESFEYFCQKSSKSISTILSYTVSKLVHFLRHSVLVINRKSHYTCRPSWFLVDFFEHAGYRSSEHLRNSISRFFPDYFLFEKFKKFTQHCSSLVVVSQSSQQQRTIKQGKLLRSTEWLKLSDTTSRFKRYWRALFLSTKNM